MFGVRLVILAGRGDVILGHQEYEAAGEILFQPFGFAFQTGHAVVAVSGRRGVDVQKVRPRRIEQPLPVREARTLNDLTACANSFLGVPYLWGGTTPAGFDCSGLVQYCYREVFNIELPRTTYYQCEVGVEVPFEELLPGDLLFFADGGDVHHVAMYLGDGYYVEAPHTGDVVKITAMNDKLPDFAKRVVDVRGIDMSEFSDEQLAQFVEREKYLQEREQRLGVTDETLAELTEWLRGLEF